MPIADLRPAHADAPRHSASVLRTVATTTVVIFTLGAGTLTSAAPADASIPTCLKSRACPIKTAPQKGTVNTDRKASRGTSAKRYRLRPGKLVLKGMQQPPLQPPIYR